MQKFQKYSKFEEEWPILQFISPIETVYFNTRVSKYSKRHSFLERRTNSQIKVINKYNARKNLLIDEQMIHTKTMMHENKAIVNKFFHKTLLPEEQTKMACFAEGQYKHVKEYLKYYQWRIEKHERSYSQPKFQQATYHKNLPKKLKFQYYPFKSSYYLGHWQKLEESIIQRKFSKAQALKFLQQSSKIQDFLYLSNQLWRRIQASLNRVRIQAEFDIFSSQIATKSLKQYHKFLMQKQNSFISALFQNEFAYSFIGMDEKTIRKLRINKLQLLSESIGIKNDGINSINLDKIYYNFKRLKKRLYPYDYKRFLTKVFEIRKIESAGAEGKYYSVEYYMGLKKIFQEQELLKTHPQQFKNFLI